MSDSDTKAEAPKDGWDKVGVVSFILGAVAVPILVAWLTSQYALARSDRELDVRLVDLGLGVLKTDPRRTEQPGVRSWSLDVVEKYSGVPFSAEARAELREGAFKTAALTVVRKQCIGVAECRCEEGQVALGGGADLPGGSNVSLRTSFPSGDLRGWVTECLVDNQHNKPCAASYAICIPEDVPLKGAVSAPERVAEMSSSSPSLP